MIAHRGRQRERSNDRFLTNEITRLMNKNTMNKDEGKIECKNRGHSTSRTSNFIFYLRFIRENNLNRAFQLDLIFLKIADLIASGLRNFCELEITR